MNLLTVLRVAVVAAFAGTVASAAAQTPSPAALTVFAASDLGPAFKQIVPKFERKARARITLVLGSTGMLAQQIRNGAPADVFFAANETFVTQLSSEQLTLKPSETVYARGRVAVVALRSGALKVDSLSRPGRRACQARRHRQPATRTLWPRRKAGTRGRGPLDSRGTEARLRGERPAGRAVCPQRIGRGRDRRTIGIRYPRSHVAPRRRAATRASRSSGGGAGTHERAARRGLVHRVRQQRRRPDRHAAIRLPPARRVSMKRRAARRESGEGCAKAASGAGHWGPASEAARSGARGPRDK